MVTSKVTGEGADHNFRAGRRRAKLRSTRVMLSEAKHLTCDGWIAKELRMFYLPVRGPSLGLGRLAKYVKHANHPTLHTR